MGHLNLFSYFPEEIVDSIALAADPPLVQAIRKYANLSVMAGLDPAIYAASAPFASRFKFR
jgi:Asp/Glu/hydantoin racemase